VGSWIPFCLKPKLILLQAHGKSLEAHGVGSVLAMLDKLPAEVQTLARRNYQLLRADPSHPSLQFKSLGGARMYSVRVGLH
jgi:hypothetical protein